MNIPNLSSLKGLGTIAKTFVMANRPEILLGASIASTLASVGLAAKGGYEAGQKVMVEEHPSYDLSKPEAGAELTTRQKANLTWHCYMPAGIAGIGAIGATTGLHLAHISDKKILVSTALGAIEEVKDAAREYEEERNGALEANAAKTTGKSKLINSDGEVEEMYLVRDHRTQRDIWSNQHRIEDALIEIGNVINGSGEVELNHFYNHAGFGAIPDGLALGWSGVIPSLEWTETKRDDGRPVREFKFRPQPSLGFDDAAGRR